MSLRMPIAVREQVERALGYLMGQSPYDAQACLEKLLGYKVDSEGERIPDLSQQNQTDTVD